MPPTLVAIEMGYGHLRPAHALAGELRVPVLEADRPPLAGAGEQELWARVRHLYEGLSRISAGPWGRALPGVLDGITHIPPLHPERDLSAPTAGARVLEWLVGRGLGAGLARRLEEPGGALLTTFFAPAVASDQRSRAPIWCVVTDSDVNRIWVPVDPRGSRVRYFAPSPRVVRRLVAYGVPRERITFSGFPLPGELVGGRERTALRRNLAARLVRLDPDGVFTGARRAELERELGPLPADQRGVPPLVTFAIGGAGAQVDVAEAVLAALRAPLREGRVRLALVAGVRAAVAARFRAAVAATDAPGVSVLHEPDLPAYLQGMNELLARTDILWTKPSEMSFFAALGLPVVFSAPVGVHEAYNRRWVIESGGGLAQREPAHAAGWLGEWLADGTLAATAWSGATRLPSVGLYAIAEEVRREEGAL
jgi:UDP-N-acetylglucosamine:LPS N-acetylglucosamine transferase